MPATIEDYNKVTEQAQNLQTEAGEYGSTATSLSSQVMEAVRKDRASRGVSQMAADVGTTSGQLVSDSAGIRERTGDMVNPLQQDVLTSSQRGQNLNTLATLSTQSEYNQGTLKDIIGEHADSLRALAERKMAEAEEKAYEATSVLDMLKFEASEKARAFDEMMRKKESGTSEDNKWILDLLEMLDEDDGFIPEEEDVAVEDEKPGFWSSALGEIFKPKPPQPITPEDVRGGSSLRVYKKQQQGKKGSSW